jgi:hypothetical protein
MANPDPGIPLTPDPVWVWIRIRIHNPDLDGGFSSSREASSSPERQLSRDTLPFLYIFSFTDYGTIRPLKGTINSCYFTPSRYSFSSYELKNILVSGSGLAPLRRPPVLGAGAGGTAGRNPGRAAALAAPHPAVGPGKGLTVHKYTCTKERQHDG